MGVMLLKPDKIRMVGNEGPITDCLFHRVTKYSGFHDACVRFSFLFFWRNGISQINSFKQD